MLSLPKWAWFAIVATAILLLVLVRFAFADHFDRERAAIMRGKPAVTTSEPGNVNWSRREAGDYRTGNCAGLDHKNFGPCKGYYVWTKYGAGGPWRDYRPDSAGDSGPGAAAPSAPVSAPPAAPPSGPPGHGGHGHGHGGGHGHGHGGHGHGGKGR